MGYTVNSIEVGADAERVFRVTNDPRNFVALMGYKSVDVLARTPLVDGRELVRFRITNVETEDDGKVVEEQWVSHRIVDEKNLRARGVRESPMFPFVWWILDISYDRIGAGRTRLTWTQDFSIDPRTGHTDGEIEGYIDKGSRKELEKLRNLIETGSL